MVTLTEIEAAQARIRHRVRHTPTVPLAPLRHALPYEVRLKLEHLQVTGSFKPRGALNKILSLEREAVAGGNHGLGVAYAAWLLGVPAMIYVPEKASQARRDRLSRWNARVIVGGRDWDDANAAASAEAARARKNIILLRRFTGGPWWRKSIIASSASITSISR
jgi:threonine dehydratase